MPKRAALKMVAGAALATLLLIGVAPTAQAAARTPVPAPTYLALGDSLSYGYHAAQFAAEYPNIDPASFDAGFVDDFGAALKLAQPDLQVVNDGCPGETSDTLIYGSGLPGYCAGGPTGTPFPYAWLHHPYAAGSQLADALSIVASSNVSVITLNIGSNDLLQFLEHTCGFPATFTCGPSQISGEFTHIVTNVGIIAGTLHAAAPRAKIVVLGLYNPYPTVLPAPGGDYLVKQLNSSLAAVAASIPGVSLADPEPVFNPAGYSGLPETGDIPTVCLFTAMCPGGTYNPSSPSADIHPTTLGYAVLAGVIGWDYLTH